MQKNKIAKNAFRKFINLFLPNSAPDFPGAKQNNSQKQKRNSGFQIRHKTKNRENNQQQTG
jgi:hypothetical protein